MVKKKLGNVRERGKSGNLNSLSERKRFTIP